MKQKDIEKAYELAKQRYAELGVDSERALKRLAGIAISMHCWQGDDVGGFENKDAALDGGLAVTGNYPGRARSADELRCDLEKAFGLVPGRHRVNVHAIYAETQGRNVERNALAIEHFSRWIDWAKAAGLGMDLNPTCFSHPKAADGLTLSHRDEGIRRFWIEHVQACRRIGAAIGKSLGSPCVTNVWVPDGMKDSPADRKGPRERLRHSLDEAFADKLDPRHNLDSVESKLFGIGTESFVVGSHEFYLGYAVRNNILLCLDTGHFHPTELVSDKISSTLAWVSGLLLHVSRGVRWDSDHVVILSDELVAIAQEIVRGGYLDRVHIALDYFDASINRVAAWVIGMRAMLKAMLAALLEPTSKLAEMEEQSDFTSRLALMEQVKTMPFGAVWDCHCARHGAPLEAEWMDEVRRYEKDVLRRRV